MNGAPLTRQQKRAMQRNANEVDKAVAGDRRFFDRFPGRHYRVRPLSQAECAQLEIFEGKSIKPPPGYPVTCTVLKVLAPGVRIRATVFATPDIFGHEMPEDEARAVYEGAARQPGLRELEAQIVAAARKPGGPLHNQTEGK